jgi:hypothetical protein
MTNETNFGWGPDSLAPDAPRVRIAFGDVVRKVAIFTLFMELVLFSRFVRVNRRWFRHPKRFLILIAAAPRMLVIAFLIGAVSAVLIDLLVRFVVQPLVRVWYNPPSDSAACSFHFSAGEAIEGSTPARRDLGRRGWQPGALVRTNRRLWFFPRSWDAEPWTVTLGDVRALRGEPPPRMGLGFVIGLPDRLEIVEASGKSERFAVAEPESVLNWFPAARSAGPRPAV